MNKVNSSSFITTSEEQKRVEDNIASKYNLDTEINLNSHLENKMMKLIIARETVLAVKSSIKLESGDFYKIDTKYKGKSFKVSIGAIEVSSDKPLEITYGVLEL